MGNSAGLSQTPAHRYVEGLDDRPAVMPQFPFQNAIPNVAEQLKCLVLNSFHEFLPNERSSCLFDARAAMQYPYFFLDIAAARY